MTCEDREEVRECSRELPGRRRFQATANAEGMANMLEEGPRKPAWLQKVRVVGGGVREVGSPEQAPASRCDGGRPRPRGAGGLECRRPAAATKPGRPWVSSRAVVSVRRLTPGSQLAPSSQEPPPGTQGGVLGRPGHVAASGRPLARGEERRRRRLRDGGCSVRSGGTRGAGPAGPAGPPGAVLLRERPRRARGPGAVRADRVAAAALRGGAHGARGGRRAGRAR